MANTHETKEQKDPTILLSHDTDCRNGGVRCGANEECLQSTTRDFHVSKFIL